jgi:phosphonate transport system substrate-binding protein
VFRVTAIPDESPTELARKAAPLMKYLEARLGMKVEFTPVTDEAAVVEALASRMVDLAWFGGFTFVQAQVRSGGKVIPIVQREEDEKFRSVFITSDPAIKQLTDLKGKDVSFGSQSSTSGHLMPRSVLLQAGVDPDKDFKRVACSVAHDATIAAVAAGEVQAGGLNNSVCDKFVADKKVDTGKVIALYTAPTYYDDNWTVHADMPAAQREKLTLALLHLDRADPVGKEILELQRATRFVPAKAANYKGIEAAARSAGLQAFGFGLLPQNTGELTSYTVYRLECAIRSSVGLGFFGAGGLGQQLDSSMKMFAAGEVSTLLAVFLALVALADHTSAWLRNAPGMSAARRPAGADSRLAGRATCPRAPQ